MAVYRILECAQRVSMHMPGVKHTGCAHKWTTNMWQSAADRVDPFFMHPHHSSRLRLNKTLVWLNWEQARHRTHEMKMSAYKTGCVYNCCLLRGTHKRWKDMNDGVMTYWSRYLYQSVVAKDIILLITSQYPYSYVCEGLPALHTFFYTTACWQWTVNTVDRIS